MAVDAPPFGALLRRQRRAAGLTQEALAARAGLSARGVSDLERGTRRHPYPATARRLADALAPPEAERAALLATARPPAAPAQPDVERLIARRLRHGYALAGWQ